MKIILSILILASTSISGCANDSGVVLAKDQKSFFEGSVYSGKLKILAEDTTGSEQYRVFQQAATGFIPTSVVRKEVEEQAFKHCENMGKSLRLLQERTSPLLFLPGNFPRAELLFVCLPKPITPITSSFEDQLYIKLTNLKKLFDNGTITQDEFEQQKTKMLNQK